MSNYNNGLKKFKKASILKNVNVMYYTSTADKQVDLILKAIKNKQKAITMTSSKS